MSKRGKMAIGVAVPAVLAAVAVFAAVAGPSSSADHAVQPVRYVPGSLDAAALRSGQSPGSLLRDLVARYGGHALRADSLAIGSAPSGWRPTEGAPASAPLPDGIWVNGTVAIPASGAAAVRPVWEANLVIAALRDRVHAGGASPDVIGSQISGELPDGRVLPNIGGGIGNVAFLQAFSTASPGEAVRDVRRNAATLGLRIDSIDVLTPLQAAPAVVATTHDVAGLIRNPDAVVNALFGGIARYEGEYLEVRDAAGSPVFIQASAFRTGVGQRWYRADLDPRQPIPATASDPSVG
jgi:hypothetical protein